MRRNDNNAAACVWRRTLMVMLALMFWCLGGAIDSNAATVEKLAQVRVESVPPGATVVCDGVVRDATPLTLNVEDGEHLITASKSGYIEARETVHQALRGQRRVVNLQLDPITGLVVIECRPAGADIEINGAHRGHAPLLATDLPLGRYRVIASAPGYARREVDLTIENRTPQRLAIVLLSDSASLAMSSEPSGGIVTIDGTQRGTTPCTVDRVAAGEHAIAITLDKCKPWTRSLKVQAGDELKVNARLEMQPALLRISSEPAGANVFVNDEPRGKTPAVVENLAPGSYALRVEMAGYAVATQAVCVSAAEEQSVTFPLLRNVGVLEVTTAPPGVQILVDGHDRGATQPGDSEGVSAMLRMDDLQAGVHRVRLVAKGFFPLDRTVTIERGGTAILKELLKRKFESNTAVRLQGGDVLVGMLSRKLPNGDLELETSVGIFKTVKAANITSVDQISVGGK